MSSQEASHATDSQDPVESIIHSIPIVLPVVGAVLIFLLALIAVAMT